MLQQPMALASASEVLASAGGLSIAPSSCMQLHLTKNLTVSKSGMFTSYVLLET